MKRLGRAVLAAVSAGAIIATGASFGRSTAGVERSAVPATVGDERAARAAADSLADRLSELERRLGLANPARDRARADFRARYEQLREREQAVARRAEEWLRFVPSGEPVAGGVITSAFSPGRYHPIKLRVIPHVGLDISARHGSAVRATADGTVFATADHATYGLTVDLRHGDLGFLTRYAHLSRISVQPGQTVRRGDVIGAVGSTGLSTGPHTHYEVFYRGWRRDPIDFLPPGAVAEQALLGVD